jgi:hypothetical protein
LGDGGKWQGSYYMHETISLDTESTKKNHRSNAIEYAKTNREAILWKAKDNDGKTQMQYFTA